jgi:hypothetical protein
MQTSILTIKAQSLYCACSPEFGLISYGNCWDEAVNNLQDEVSLAQQERKESSNAS